MTRYVIALDMGGTKLDGALVTDRGEIISSSRSRVPTGRALTRETLRQALTDVITTAIGTIDTAEIVGLGIGAPGPIAPDGTLAAVNLPGVHGFALHGELRNVLAGLGLNDPHIEIGHDGGCFALGEAMFGVTRDSRASMGVVVSTGVGCGIVMNGELLRGTSGNAGHIGQTLDESGVTVEEVAAGPHIVAWARAQGFAGETGIELSEANAAGDPIARAAIMRSARAAGRAIGNVVTLLDLDSVVVGGGFSEVSDDFRDLIAAEIRASSVLAYAQNVRVLAPTLGNDGALKGAASLVLSKRA